MSFWKPRSVTNIHELVGLEVKLLLGEVCPEFCLGSFEETPKNLAKVRSRLKW